MWIDGIIGRRGTGKTSLLVELADRYATEGYNTVLVQSVKALYPGNPKVHKVWTFAGAIRVAWRSRPAVICVDEFTAFEKDPNMDYILKYGRNVQIALLYNTMRAAMIETSMRALTNRFYCFQIQDSVDYRWYKENLGEQYADKARSLAEHEYFTFPEEKHESAKAPYIGDRDIKPPESQRGSEGVGGLVDGPDELFADHRGGDRALEGQGTAPDSARSQGHSNDHQRGGSHGDGGGGGEGSDGEPDDGFDLEELG